MPDSLVSVVIPVYNQAQYVREAVLSACAQGENIEIIVVDDASPRRGEVEGALSGLEDSVRLITLTRNRGLAGARNAGIAEAHGELILPLDADDNLKCGAIRRLKQALLEYPQADVAYGYLREFEGGSGIWGYSGGWPLRALLETNRLPYSSIFRKSAWERVGGYDEKMRLGYEDWEFWIRLACSGSQFVCINDVTLLYRKRPGSMYEKSLQYHNDIIAYIQAKHADYYVKSGKMRRFIELPWSFDCGAEIEYNKKGA